VELRAAADAIRAAGLEALAALVEEWERPDAPAPAAEGTANELVTLDLLAESRDPRWLPFARARERQPGLRLAALRALAIFGDPKPCVELTELWRERLRTRLFLARYIELTASDPARQAALEWAVAEAAYVGDGLQLAPAEGHSAWLAPLLEGFWSCWGWLGQQQGERYAAELFELAKPHRNANADFRERVRSARRLLDETGQQGAPVAAAAAGVILAQLAPQYESLRERITARLCGALSESAAPDQQRLAWALARLERLTFGGMGDAQHPSQFQAGAVRDALAWGRRIAPGEAIAPRAETAYPKPPVLTRRVITAERQLEAKLLRELVEDWGRMSAGLERWRREGLGCTPGALALLHPGQREPSLPGLAAAAALVAEGGAQEARDALQIWREALDQPEWVRGFAATALAALEVRAGRPTDWPEGLRDTAFVDVGKDRPSWELWGRVLAAGGEGLWSRLSGGANSLSPVNRDRLLYEAQRAARWRPEGPGP
jgi:hypothetical protein